MTTQKPDLADINKLAIEACDMWQEHLSTLASDPSARAELTRFLEPQRRLFADWAAMMQQGGSHDAKRSTASTPNADATASPPPSAAPGGATHGDDSLRVAQLALRVAELEKRIAQLEKREPSAARSAQRAAS